jgi:Bacterial Ig-like domain (group 3)
MNVRLSVGTVWNKGKGMRTAGRCMVFLGILAAVGFTASAAAEDTAATRTTLAVATNSTGPRTRLTLTAHVAASNAEQAAPGVVNFRSGEMDLGSALLDAEGSASLETDSLPAGSHQVVAVYMGSTGYHSSLSASAQVQANVSAVAGFTVTATPTALSTAVGGFVTSVVTIIPANGFSGYVSLSCTGLPVNATCNFTPLNVPASCTASTSGAQTCTPATSVMQIQTLAPSGAFLNLGEGGTLRYAFVFPALLGVVGLGARRSRAWRNLTLVMVVFGAMMGMTACSQRYNYLNHGPPGNTGTPTGTYPLTIQAQSSTGSNTTTPPTYPQLTLTITGN